MPERRRKPNPWPTPAQRTAVYDEMMRLRFKAGAQGWEPPFEQLRSAKTVEEAQVIRDRSLSRYMENAADELRGMVRVVAVLEGKTMEDVYKAIRGY